MTIVTDLVHDVLAYLVTACQASPLLGAATPPVAVFDGPTPPGELLTSPLRLWIGYNALTGAPDAGTATQVFAYVGNDAGRRREDGAVVCTAEAWSGDPVAGANNRLACKTITGGVEQLLRGTPLIGPGDSSMGGLVQWSQTAGPFSWTQAMDENGSSAMCVFRVTYTAYLHP